jgi:hypothetical protein
MKATPNARETRACAAKVGAKRAPGPEARCGVPALDFGDVRVAGALVEIPLCRKHFRELRDSADPRALARAWALEPTAP